MVSLVGDGDEVDAVTRREGTRNIALAVLAVLRFLDCCSSSHI